MEDFQEKRKKKKEKERKRTLTDTLAVESAIDN